MTQSNTSSFDFLSNSVDFNIITFRALSYREQNKNVNDGFLKEHFVFFYSNFTKISKFLIAQICRFNQVKCNINLIKGRYYNQTPNNSKYNMKNNERQNNFQQNYSQSQYLRDYYSNHKYQIKTI